MKSAALFRLFQLVSPALPVGAYAYSQAQEWAVETGWVSNKDQAQDWIEGVLLNSVARLDVVCLSRFYAAWQAQDLDQIRYWNEFLTAQRETSELLLEDEQLGAALQRLMISLVENDEDPTFKANVEAIQKPTFACMFALAGVIWQVPVQELAQGFVWSWLENQVAAATKLVPLGQTQAQQLLLALSEKIDEATDIAANLADEEIGSGLPALAIASSLHERQYSRLFRS